MAKSGHSFPSSAGFSNSTGKKQSVKGYTRSLPVKKALGGVMRGPGVMSGPKTAIAPPQALPAVGPKPTPSFGGMRPPPNITLDPIEMGPGTNFGGNMDQFRNPPPVAPTQSSQGPWGRPAVPPMPVQPRPGLGRPPGRGALAYARGGKVPPFKPGLSPSPPKGPKTMPGYASGGHVETPDMKTDVIGDQGNSVVKRGKPFITEFDVDHGGTAPLRTGYKKGGKTKGPAAIAKKEVAKHVAAPAPKGHKGFNKLPMFGKK